jgi:formate hydrogenlyase subunit 6/NADH:ubiquinone oxidoreductase subunit I
MRFEVDKSKCTGCGACVRACPYGAIKIGEDGKAFIDQSKCRKCGKCKRVCPFDAIKEIPDEGDKESIKQPNVPSSPVRESSLSFSPLPGRRISGRRGGRRMGMGFGRGLGRGSRGGRGRGRGGGRG